jgi:long-subunit fatty acid transport protein
MVSIAERFNEGMTKMSTDFGARSHLDDDFKRRARLHQSKFRTMTLGFPSVVRTATGFSLGRGLRSFLRYLDVLAFNE